MNFETRDRLVEQFDELSLEILQAKGADYGRDSNIFNDFDMVAQFAGITREQACMAFMCKHLASIQKWVSDPGELASEPIEERLFDLGNYARLMYCMVKDMKGTP